MFVQTVFFFYLIGVKGGKKLSFNSNRVARRKILLAFKNYVFSFCYNELEDLISLISFFVWLKEGGIHACCVYYNYGYFVFALSEEG